MQSQIDYLRAEIVYLRSSAGFRIGALIRGLLRGPGGWKETGSRTFSSQRARLKPLSRHKPRLLARVQAGDHVITLRGRLLEHQSERSRAALVNIRFQNARDAMPTLEAVSGCRVSEEVGLFHYVQPNESGDFEIAIGALERFGAAELYLRAWGNEHRVYVDSIDVGSSSDVIMDSQSSACEDDRQRHRIALFGDLDLNIVDGSAVWLASMAEVLSRVDGAHVDVYLRNPPRRRVLTSALEGNPSITLFHRRSHTPPYAAARAILRNEQRQRYDLVIVRGLRAAAAFSACPELYGRLAPYITDLPASDLLSAEATILLRSALSGARQILCQTAEIEAFIGQLESQPSTVRVPPMVPDVESTAAVARDERFRLAYAGKFASLWGIEELCEVFLRLRDHYPEIELHVFGDKFHDGSDDRKTSEMFHQFLTSTDGVFWYRSLPRQEMLIHLRSMSAGWAWRRPDLEEQTRELSTKVLEYGSAGLPVILYPNRINTTLLGESYPLYARSSDEAYNAIANLIEHRSGDESARRALSAAAEAHTFLAVARRLERELDLSGSH